MQVYYRVIRAEIFKSPKPATIDHRMNENDNISKEIMLEQNWIARNENTIIGECKSDIEQCGKELSILFPR